MVTSDDCLAYVISFILEYIVAQICLFSYKCNPICDVKQNKIARYAVVVTNIVFIVRIQRVIILILLLVYAKGIISRMAGPYLAQ